VEELSPRRPLGEVSTRFKVQLNCFIFLAVPVTILAMQRDKLTPFPLKERTEICIQSGVVFAEPLLSLHL